ncbi:hypothetical protein [Saccharopolyspora griseoalba]|uniref:Uncharacterized protein n=1 Tax=Saccharopolyspora griseoalba TaxID=1431848 RepID=A0ABW2LTG0_9PSEU
MHANTLTFLAGDHSRSLDGVKAVKDTQQRVWILDGDGQAHTLDHRHVASVVELRRSRDLVAVDPADEPPSPVGR